MLTREKISAELRAQPLDLHRCWLTAGAALVFHGLRETTRDIDLGCESSQAEELEAAGFVPESSVEGNRRFHLGTDIDLSENFARGTVQFIDGIPVVSLEDILRLKRQLNRPKDQADIQNIERVLELQKP